MANSVGEAQQSVHSQKREVNEKEEELCWGKDALRGSMTLAWKQAPLIL